MSVYLLVSIRKFDACSLLQMNSFESAS